MKKVNALVFAGILLSIPLYPQVMFMPKAGVTLANVAFSDDIKNAWGADFGSKVGFIVGLAVEVPLSGDVLFLQPELLWHQKGFSYTWVEPGYKEDYDYTFNYAEIPVLLKVKAAHFYALAGPSLGVGIIGKYKGTYTENGDEVEDSDWIYFGGDAADYDEDEEWVDNMLDVGIQVGAGVEVVGIVIELRYGFGLSNLYDERPDFAGNVKSQHRSAQLTVGVPLGKGRRDH